MLRNQNIFGVDAYHVVLWFLAYSILGWCVESLYMSYCNKKWTNRGFAKSPICPIYGVGALTVFFVLEPVSQHPVKLFILGSFLATAIEFVTAVIMKKLFGEIWWDYREKPFNYKGILCLESTIAWGFYSLFLFAFLHKAVAGIVNMIPQKFGRSIGTLIVIVYLIDFVRTLHREKREEKSEFEELKQELCTAEE